MDRKKNLLCLDKCEVLPKLILDMEVQAQHYGHDYQPLEEIYQRLNQSDNLKIVKEFLKECSQEKCNLDSLISQYDMLKKKILNNFQQNLDQFFKKIYKIQTKDWKENNRRERTLRSITPDFKQEFLSQIEGDFEFLRQEQLFGDLKKRVSNKKERDFRAKDEIEQLVSKSENSFENFIRWGLDGQQEKRSQMIEQTKTSLEYKFIEKRILEISGIFDANLNQTINLIKEIKPEGIIIYINNNQLSDISPFSEFKTLVNLTSLDIDLSNNQLSNISPLSEFKALVNLTSLVIDLSNNQLSDISPLSEFKALVNLTSLIIGLSDNKLTNISPLSEFKALVNLTILKIYLSQCLLSDISPLSEFKALVNLTSLEINLKYQPSGFHTSIVSLQDLKSLFELNN